MADTGQDVINSLVEPLRKYYDLAEKYLGDPSAPSKYAKKTWEADPEDVRKANESFRKPVEDKKPLAKRTLGGKARTKKGAKKATARKKK